MQRMIAWKSMRYRDALVRVTDSFGASKSMENWLGIDRSVSYRLDKVVCMRLTSFVCDIVALP